MQRRAIAKRPPRKAATVAAAAEAREDARGADDADQECCVCYLPLKEKSAFPCAHATCATCFEKLEICPICRTGKDGISGLVRQETRDREERAAREARDEAFASSRETVVYFQGTPPGEHPFENTFVVNVAPNLSPAMLASLPEVLARSLVGLRGRPPRSVGERQNRAAEILRMGGGRLRIQNIFERQDHR